MFFDPTLRAETKVEPLSLPAFITWLEKQPSSETYCYLSSGNCLAAQYCRSIGEDYSTPFPFRLPFTKPPFRFVMERIAMGHPRTFGDALDRAREKMQRSTAHKGT